MTREPFMITSRDTCQPCRHRVHNEAADIEETGLGLSDFPVLEVESTEDRRVRIIALTPRGKDLIVSAFRKHSGHRKNVFSELTPEELRVLEAAIKKVGKRAAALMDQR